MSRIGKKSIIIPEGVEVTKDGNELIVRGPKGTLSRTFREGVIIELQGKEVKFSVAEDASREIKVLWGTYASHARNMIEGVRNGFEKKLIIEGAGYKANLKDGILVLNVGFSHPVIFRPPENVVLKVEKNTIIVSGLDKEKVTSTANRIRSLKKPEPYKGKGIHYENEIVRRKAGKKTVGTAA